MYIEQHNMLKAYNKEFVIPSYFSAWVSGFIESEGCFRLYSDKRRDNAIFSRFNIGQNYEQFIIRAIRDYFGGSNKVQEIVSKKEFTEKRQLLDVKHYYVEMGSKAVKAAIFTHFSQYPLLGDKQRTYYSWCEYLDKNNTE